MFAETRGTKTGYNVKQVRSCRLGQGPTLGFWYQGIVTKVAHLMGSESLQS